MLVIAHLLNLPHFSFHIRLKNKFISRRSGNQTNDLAEHVEVRHWTIDLNSEKYIHCVLLIPAIFPNCKRYTGCQQFGVSEAAVVNNSQMPVPSKQ